MNSSVTLTAIYHVTGYGTNLSAGALRASPWDSSTPMYLHFDIHCRFDYLPFSFVCFGFFFFANFDMLLYDTQAISTSNQKFQLSHIRSGGSADPGPVPHRTLLCGPVVMVTAGGMAITLPSYSNAWRVKELETGNGWCDSGVNL